MATKSAESSFEELRKRDTYNDHDVKKFSSTIIRLRLLRNLLDHRILRYLIPTRMQQNMYPPSFLGALEWVPYDPKSIRTVFHNDHVPIKYLYTGDRRHLSTINGIDLAMGRKYFLDMKLDSYLVISAPKKEDLRVQTDATEVKIKLQAGFGEDRKNFNKLCTRFPLDAEALPARFQFLGARAMTLMYITSLTPDDIKSDWFPALAKILLNTQVEIGIKCREGPIKAPSRPSPFREHMTSGLIDRTTFKAKAHVNGLTATMLVMKAHYDLEAMARVFFFSPSQIAQEVRVFGLGPVMGVAATRALLACIFSALGKGEYEINQCELMLAATHLLVAHISRKDYHNTLRQAIPGDNNLVTMRIRKLIQIPYAPNPLKDFTRYLKMATLRDGIVWGAMRAYANDLDTQNRAEVASLKMFAGAATSVASSAAGAAPMASAEASAGVQAIGSWVTLAIDQWAGARWNQGELDRAITTRFDVEVIAPAKGGIMPLLRLDMLDCGGSSPDGVNKKLSEEDVKKIQDIYVANISYVVSFALGGSVTPRLSTLGRTYRAVRRRPV